MLKSSLCNYSDAYILASGIITVAQVPAPAANLSNNNKEGINKNCAPFTDFISEINGAQIDNAKNIDVVMPMYKLIELSGNYLKTSGNLQQYQRHEPNVNNASDVADFPVDSALFKFKQKIVGEKIAGGTKDVQIMVPLKYLCSFWRILEMPLINCKNNLILT